MLLELAQCEEQRVRQAAAHRGREELHRDGPRPLPSGGGSSPSRRHCIAELDPEAVILLLREVTTTCSPLSSVITSPSKGRRLRRSGLAYIALSGIFR